MHVLALKDENGFLIVGGLYSVTALQENDQERSRGETLAASREEETHGGAKRSSVFRIVLGGVEMCACKFPS